MTRIAAILAIVIAVSGCSGGEFNPNAIDVDRLPINDDGQLFLGRELTW